MKPDTKARNLSLSQHISQKVYQQYKAITNRNARTLSITSKVTKGYGRQRSSSEMKY
jgi:pyruvate dehydrogenase complex dehydrogenase (E1) component